MGRERKDISGWWFGRWQVIEYYGVKHNCHYWTCMCHGCGEAKEVKEWSLMNAKTRHCGKCQRKITLHPSYGRWENIMERCRNPKCKSYCDYGARGIDIWEPWAQCSLGFLLYLDEELGPPPDGYSIDRIDNDGDYRPGNIRWADAVTQRSNRRDAIYLRKLKEEIDGQEN